MDKKIKINTHHAYLNTDIVLECESPSVCLKDELTGKEYHITSHTLTTNLCAGKHRLYSESLDEEIFVEIEDAIKLGGSKIKEAFVFDENPWVFVTTKDRLYATNIETKEEKIEHNLTPDEIHAYGNYYGKTCDYFLFKTKQDFSIYNVSTGTNVISFTDHIYSNSHLVIYKRENDIVVYDYRQKRTIVEFNGQYSFGSKFYFVKNGKLHGLNLSSEYINVLDCVGDVDENSILINNNLLKLYSDGRNTKRYHLYFLGNGEKNITKTEIITPYYVESIFGIKTSEYSRLVDDYTKFAEEQKVLISNNYGIDICCTGIKIEGYRTKWEDKKEMIVLNGQIVSYPTKSYKTPFILKGESTGTLNFKNVLIEPDNNTKNDNTKENKLGINLKKGEKLLGASQSENLYVTVTDNIIMLHNNEANSQTQLFPDTFDITSYNSAYFTSDGKNVVFVRSDKSIGVLGFEDMTQQPFEVEGATVARYAGFNGYKPEIHIQETNGRIPVWRDPVSLKWISESEMSNHIFMSPDREYTAKMQMKTVYYNRLTEQEISFEEYDELNKKYNWNGNASDDEKTNKSALRRQLLETYGKDILFHYMYEQNSNLIHHFQDGKLSETLIEKRIEDLNKSGEEDYIKSKPDFIPLFVDILGYVCYNKTGSDDEYRILIGRSVWFLNYVSFSYDSRYMAFGAKMKGDTWRSSEEGVFEIYDLKEMKVVDRKDNENDLHAVWMTMFNKNGDVAYYDSHANAMVAYAESDYKQTSMAMGKSLLCFSPSGKYIALSDQNYVSFIYHPSSDWGHQPSGNIFIHETKDLEKCLEQYNDFGEGIDGTTRMTRRAGNVASAAFSSDEKHLLAVSEDGVIVIRNLHLKEKDDNQKEFSNSVDVDAKENQSKDSHDLIMKLAKRLTDAGCQDGHKTGSCITPVIKH